MTSAHSLQEAMAHRPVVLDGGLATLLEARGHELTSSLWSAQLLLDEPEAIVAAHREFFLAGAEVAITASYQASFDGLEHLGLTRAESKALLRASVGCAVGARDWMSAESGPGTAPPRWVAASVGPYGAASADGSEYRGYYGKTAAQLRDWHAPRFEVLADAGADLLALETIPCLAEVQALAALVTGTSIPCWLSLTAANGRTRAGEPLAEAFELAAEVGEILAVGVNCVDPAESTDLVALATQVSGKPVIVYPNSGELWNASARKWSGTSTFNPELATGWVAAGARLVGGCCRVGPRAINDIATTLAR